MIAFVFGAVVIVNTLIASWLAYHLGVHRGRIEGINIGTWRGWRAGYVGDRLPADVRSLSELDALDRVSVSPVPASPGVPQTVFRTSDEGRPVETSDLPERGK